MTDQKDLTIETLGECKYESPHKDSAPAKFFTCDSARIRYNIRVHPEDDGQEGMLFEEAGPRARIFFEPSKTKAAIVTCGGLSPGLNNTIRSVFYELRENYGVPSIVGIRNGYLGLTPDSGRPPIPLTKEYVEPIHKLGGTVLGSSRGPQEPGAIVDFLVDKEIDILICVGGDGTQRGARAIHEEVRRRALPIAIVGIPKTIDNDIPFVKRSFGYITALSKASEVIRGAHIEARGAINGIGLVKLMGRHAGYIAAGASIVSQEVNFTLVPEIRFPLEGPKGLLPALEQRLRRREHAVIVVAEGAGQHLFEEVTDKTDASGNVGFHDIGQLLQFKIKDYFKSREFPVALKYLDPSYHIRSVPANAYDRYLCDQLGRHAVHAAMAGKTGMLIGYEHDTFINVPIPVVVSRKKSIDTSGHMWRAVLQSTGQPIW